MANEDEQINAENQSQGMSINILTIGDSPMVKDVVGTARTFLDDFILGIEAEGIC